MCGHKINWKNLNNIGLAETKKTNLRIHFLPSNRTKWKMKIDFCENYRNTKKNKNKNIFKSLHIYKTKYYYGRNIIYILTQKHIDMKL